MNVNFGQDYLAQALAAQKARLQGVSSRGAAFGQQNVDNNLNIDTAAIMELAKKNSVQNNVNVPVTSQAPSTPEVANSQRISEPSVVLGTKEALNLLNNRSQFNVAGKYNGLASIGAYSGQVQRTGNPEADLERYAEQKGISKEQARAELEAIFGKPQKPTGAGLSIMA